MKKRNGLMCLGLLTLLALLAARQVNACSTFVMAEHDRLFYGRNFDFFSGIGFIVVNPRNLAKTALVYPGCTPAQWQAKYGSITFNQLGREFPMGGMNEKGLVVECLWLKQTQYPDADSRPVLCEMQWIQYVLDNCQTVAELLAADRQVRIVPSSTRLHFLVLDRSGAAGVVEFIGGKSVLYGASDTAVKALTNAPYGECRDFVRRYRGFGGSERITRTWNTNGERFAVMADRIREYVAGRRVASVDAAFALLETVRNPGAESPTQWSIVYDPLQLSVHFQTADAPERRFLKLEEFDFNCAAPVKVYDLQGRGKGNIGHAFTDYSAAANLEHTRKIFAEYKRVNLATDVPELAIMLIGNYPQTLRCIN